MAAEEGERNKANSNMGARVSVDAFYSRLVGLLCLQVLASSEMTSEECGRIRFEKELTAHQEFTLPRST